MNDDIVARLRELDAVNCMDNDHLHDGLIIEAADEIERLRAELRKVADQQEKGMLEVA